MVSDVVEVVLEFNTFVPFHKFAKEGFFLLRNSLSIKSINNTILEDFFDNGIVSDHALCKDQNKMADDFSPCPHKSNDKQYKHEGRQYCIVLTIESIVVDVPHKGDNHIDDKKVN